MMNEQKTSENQISAQVINELVCEALAVSPRAYPELLCAYEARLRKPAGYIAEPAIIERRGPVAVVNIIGPIFRYGSVLSGLYRSISIEVLAREFTQAVEEPTIKAILLNFDSPGGQLSGLNEMAEMIFKARDKKPVVAYVGGMATSGAYWFASAAKEIVIDATAQVGSIGVVAIYLDARKAREAAGVRQIEIISSQSPKKWPDPATSKGVEQIRARLDSLTEVFIASVAKYRGVSAETVKKDFGQGDLFLGARAVTAGMVDRLGSFDETLEELKAGKATPARAPESQKTEMKIQTERSEEVMSTYDRETRETPAAMKEMTAEQIEQAMVEGSNSRRGVKPDPKAETEETDELIKAMVEGANTNRR